MVLVVVSKALRRGVRGVVHVGDRQFGEGHAQGGTFAVVWSIEVAEPLGEALAFSMDGRRRGLDHVAHFQEGCLEAAQQFPAGEESN